MLRKRELVVNITIFADKFKCNYRCVYHEVAGYVDHWCKLFKAPFADTYLGRAKRFDRVPRCKSCLDCNIKEIRKVKNASGNR